MVKFCFEPLVLQVQFQFQFQFQFQPFGSPLLGAEWPLLLYQIRGPNTEYLMIICLPVVLRRVADEQSLITASNYLELSTWRTGIL